MSSHEIVERDPSERFFRYNNILGKGAYKTVYHAFDAVNALEVAWNKLELNRLTPNEINTVVNEVNILKSVNHKNIIACFGAWEKRDEKEKVESLNFITELMSSGSLKDYVQKAPMIKLKVIRRWAFNILEAIDYLHSQSPPIMHRDLKCDNIFINGNIGELKIGDLGLSGFKQQEKALTVIGTPEFMAPELYEECYTELVDVYAFGMCLLEMVSMEYPYSECLNPAQVFKKVFNGEKPAVLARLKPSVFKDIILQCLETEDKRPTAAQLKQHPLFREWENDEGKLSNLSLLLDKGYDDDVSAYQDHVIYHASKMGRDIVVIKNDDECDSDNQNHKPTLNNHVPGVATPEHIRVDVNIFVQGGIKKKIEFYFDPSADTVQGLAEEMQHEFDLEESQLPSIKDQIYSQVAMKHTNGIVAPLTFLDEVKDHLSNLEEGDYDFDLKMMPAAVERQISTVTANHASSVSVIEIPPKSPLLGESPQEQATSNHATSISVAGVPHEIPSSQNGSIKPHTSSNNIFAVPVVEIPQNSIFDDMKDNLPSITNGEFDFDLKMGPSVFHKIDGSIPSKLISEAALGPRLVLPEKLNGYASEGHLSTPLLDHDLPYGSLSLGKLKTSNPVLSVHDTVIDSSNEIPTSNACIRPQTTVAPPTSHHDSIASSVSVVEIPQRTPSTESVPEQTGLNHPPMSSIGGLPHKIPSYNGSTQPQTTLNHNSCIPVVEIPQRGPSIESKPEQPTSSYAPSISVIETPPKIPSYDRSRKLMRNSNHAHVPETSYHATAETQEVIQLFEKSLPSQTTSNHTYLTGASIHASVVPAVEVLPTIPLDSSLNPSGLKKIHSTEQKPSSPTLTDPPSDNLNKSIPIVVVETKSQSHSSVSSRDSKGSGKSDLSNALNRSISQLDDMNVQNFNPQYFKLCRALMKAVSIGSVEKVKKLLSRGAKAAYSDYDNRTPLHLAASNGHVEIARLLIDSGANIEARDRWGVTVCDAAKDRHQTEIINLLKEYVHIDESDDDFEQSELDSIELMEYSARGLIQHVREKLMAGASVYYANYDRRTALHLAAAEGHADVVELLLVNGAKLDAKDRFNCTPVDSARNNGRFNVLSIMKEYGADISSHSNLDKQLIRAASDGKDKDVQRLLEEGAAITFTDYESRTALHLAASGGHYEVVQLLLKHGADIYAKNRQGSTPVDEAVKNGHFIVVDLFHNYENSLKKKQSGHDELERET